MVTSYNHSPIKRIDRRKLCKLAQSVWDEFKHEKCELSLTFVSRDEIVALNRSYLDKSTPTDVICFDLGEGPMGQFLADIYICPEVAQENATEYRCRLDDELRRLVVHGVLHFVGYDDATDEQRKAMHDLENKFLEKYHL